MQPGYRLRAAEARDLPALPGIERRAASLHAGRLAPERLEAVRPRAELEAGLAGAWLWVAVDTGDRPVGFALGRELVCGAHLEELDVDPEHGRRGLGRALVAQIGRVARRRGHAQLTLTTWADAPWSAPWYERQGFRVLARGELAPALERVIAEEIAKGLDWSRRVVMRRRVARGPGLWPWLAALWLGAFVALSALATRRPMLLRQMMGSLSIDDKTGHFLLMGGLAFCAVLALAGRSVGDRRISAPRVLAWVAAAATLEELIQHWLPVRTFSLWDLAASLAGVALLGGVAAGWQAWRRRPQ